MPRCGVKDLAEIHSCLFSPSPYANSGLTTWEAPVNILGCEHGLYLPYFLICLSVACSPKDMLSVLKWCFKSSVTLCFPEDICLCLQLVLELSLPAYHGQYPVLWWLMALSAFLLPFAILNSALCNNYFATSWGKAEVLQQQSLQQSSLRRAGVMGRAQQTGTFLQNEGGVLTETSSPTSERIQISAAQHHAEY